MPFDFPNSPTNGQQVTGAAGQIYQWNGTRWVGVVPPGPLPVSSGGSGSTTAVGAPWAEKATSANNVGRNLIHNPLFNIAQRGAGPFTVNSVHTADRWPLGFSGGTMTVNVAAVSDADRTSIGDEAAANNLSVAVVGGSGAGDETFMEHRLEGVRRTAGKTVTLSFYAKASVASQKIGSFLYQSFGTGGSPSGIVIIAGQAVTISTTYARYSMTFTIPSAAGKTFGTNNNDFLDLRLGLSAGATSGANYGGIGVQSATFQIWGVQLEIGSTMTPLEKPDPADDLRRCQRFYQVGSVSCWGMGTASVLETENIGMAATMRASPTCTLGTPNQNSNTSGITLGGLGGNTQLQLALVPPANGGYSYTNSWTASADL